MEFTPRVKQILLVLLNEPKVLPVKNLAEQIGVSKRTVQRELDYIGYILKKFQIELRSKTGAGIWLEGETSRKELLLAEIEGQEDTEFIDKEERRKSLMLELLKDQAPKKLYYYANLFSVSEATISKDMECVEPWFQKFDLQIIRKPGFGVTLEGSEKDYRVAVREFIAKYMNTPVLNELYEGSHLSVSKTVGIRSIKNSYQLLNEDILQRVGICFASIQDQRIQRLTEDSYIGLVLHVTIAIERVQAGEIIEANQELTEKLTQDEEYNLALLIINSLEEEFEIEMPDVEIVYICLHIKGSKVQQADGDVQNEDIRQLVQEMIMAYEPQFSYELSTDVELINGLTAHLQPTLVRLRNHMPIENPHLDEMKKSYPEIYENSKRAGKLLSDRCGYEVPEEEIGFLAIHFGAAMVRLEDAKEKKRTVFIGLVCASGIGISRLMASRLKKYLKSKVKITTYGKVDLTPFILEHNDFFVSSMDLGVQDAEVLQVSPLLPEDDLVHIEELAAKYAVQPKSKEDNKNFSKQMEKINNLAGEIKEILEQFTCMKVDANLTFDGLLQAAAARITSYRENQLRIIGDIKRREDIATQIIPELDIALLHARSHGLVQTGFYVCVPSNHGHFTDEYMQSVSAAVIMLVPNDEHQQENSHLIGFLSEKLLDDEYFLENIKSGDEMVIRENLERLLKQYFTAYLDVVQE